MSDHPIGLQLLFGFRVIVRYGEDQYTGADF